MTAPLAPPLPRPPRAAIAPRLTWCGLALALGAMLFRATVAFNALPGWDPDPTLHSLSVPALGPAGSMLVDALILLGACAMMAGQWAAGRRLHLGWIAAAIIGGAAVILHGWWLQATGSPAAHGTLGNQRLGASWLSAIIAAVAIAHAAREVLVRRTVAGILAAFVLLLAIRGAQQVFIEHPQTLAAFNADRDAFFAGRGWTPDSPMALAYIRRISQPEATGWFGLSNVVASFAAMGVGIGLGWLAAAWRGSRRDKEQPASTFLAPVAVTAASAAALFLAGSRGGFVTGAIAFCLLAAALLAARLTRAQHAARWTWISRLAPLIGPVCIAAPLAAVVVRGLIGERIGELSILFRWFYMQAAARMFAVRPLTGVGPDGFQPAYLLAKNPLSPEEVASPHSVLLDWLSTLGAPALAWAALLVGLAIFAGRTLLTPAPDPGNETPAQDPAARIAIRAGMLTLAGATIVAAWLESPLIPPDIAAVRLGALVAGCFAVYAAVRHTRDQRLFDAGLAAGALALLAHTQIELTATHAASAGLALAALGAAAGAGLNLAHSVESTASKALGHKGALPGALVAAGLAGLLLSAGVLPAAAWERELKAAAAHAAPVADIHERTLALAQPPLPGLPREDPARLRRDVAALLGREVPTDPAAWPAAMAALDLRLLPAAAEGALAAQRRYPDEWRIGREAGRIHIRLAIAARMLGDIAASRKHADLALAAIRPTPQPGADPDVTARNAPRLRAEAITLETLARERLIDPAALGEARAVLERAFELDPYTLDLALRLYRLSRELNDPAGVRKWAAKTLELDRLMRLDPDVRGLTPSQRTELEAAIASVAPPDGP